MKRCYSVICTTLTFVVLFSGPALADDGPGTKAVKEANESIKKLLRQKAKPGSKAEAKLAEQVTQSVRNFLDVEALGRRALSKHWDKISTEQQTEFMTLLRKLIEKNYIKGLRSNLDYKISYLGEKKKGSNLVVSTEVKTKRKGRPYTVTIDYVLQPDGDALRAFDVITDGVGLVENYRAQFNKIINKRGFDGLLKRMRKKAAKLDK